MINFAFVEFYNRSQAEKISDSNKERHAANAAKGRNPTHSGSKSSGGRDFNGNTVKEDVPF